MGCGMAEHKFIEVRGAREHNLKNVDVDIPRDQFVVITGLSGSGKSSLAFDTIYAEGQRRYVESLSAYARQFLWIWRASRMWTTSSGLSALQYPSNKRPLRKTRVRRSGPSRKSTTICACYGPASASPIRPPPACRSPLMQVQDMVDAVMAMEEGARAFLCLAPIIRDRKGGNYRKEFLELRKQGFQRVKVDGAFHDLEDPPTLDKKLRHDIDVVVDRICIVKDGLQTRLADSFRTALNLADGIAVIETAPAEGEGIRITYSEKFAAMSGQRLHHCRD